MKKTSKPSRTGTSREAWASGADPANSARADCYWLVLITLESQLEGLARPQSAQPLHALMILESRLLHCTARQMPHAHEHARWHTHTHTQTHRFCINACACTQLSVMKVMIISVCMCVSGTADAADWISGFARCVFQTRLFVGSVFNLVFWPPSEPSQPQVQVGSLDTLTCSSFQIGFGPNTYRELSDGRTKWWSHLLLTFDPWHQQAIFYQTTAAFSLFRLFYILVYGATQWCRASINMAVSLPGGCVFNS